MDIHDHKHPIAVIVLTIALTPLAPLITAVAANVCIEGTPGAGGNLLGAALLNASNGTGDVHSNTCKVWGLKPTSFW